MMMPCIISLPEVIQKWIVQLLYALWEILLNKVIIQTNKYIKALSLKGQKAYRQKSKPEAGGPVLTKPPPIGKFHLLSLSF